MSGVSIYLPKANGKAIDDVSATHHSDIIQISVRSDGSSSSRRLTWTAAPVLAGVGSYVG